MSKIYKRKRRLGERRQALQSEPKAVQNGSGKESSVWEGLRPNLLDQKQNESTNSASGPLKPDQIDAIISMFDDFRAMRCDRGPQSMLMQMYHRLLADAIIFHRTQPGMDEIVARLEETCKEVFCWLLDHDIIDFSVFLAPFETAQRESGDGLSRGTPDATE